MFCPLVCWLKPFKHHDVWWLKRNLVSSHLENLSFITLRAQRTRVRAAYGTVKWPCVSWLVRHPHRLLLKQNHPHGVAAESITRPHSTLLNRWNILSHCRHTAQTNAAHLPSSCPLIIHLCWINAVKQTTDKNELWNLRTFSWVWFGSE